MSNDEMERRRDGCSTTNVESRSGDSISRRQFKKDAASCVSLVGWIHMMATRGSKSLEKIMTRVFLVMQAGSNF